MSDIASEKASTSPRTLDPGGITVDNNDVTDPHVAYFEETQAPAFRGRFPSNIHLKVSAFLMLIASTLEAVFASLRAVFNITAPLF